MALTPIQVTKLSSGYEGAITVAGSQLGPASYPTGGFAVDLITDLGIRVAPDYSQVDVSASYSARYIVATKKIMVYYIDVLTGLLIEAPNTTAMNTLTFTIVATELSD